MKSERVEEIQLKAMCFGSRSILSPLITRNEVYADDILSYEMPRVIWELECTVFGEVLEEGKWPVNWWQAFRERWFPEFWLSRYPVQYDHVSAAALYPKIAWPAGQPVLRVLKWNGDKDALYPNK